MKTLIAGPFVGEFGWELFGWQSYIREYSKEFDKTVIISRQQHQIFYQDFYNQYKVYDPPKQSILDSYVCSGHRIPDNIYDEFRINKEGIEFLYFDHPEKAFKWMVGRGQRFVKYGNDLDHGYDILIHARMIEIGNNYRVSRNWQIQKWEMLVQSLLHDGFTIASIGKSGSSIHIQETDNLLDIHLIDLVNTMANAKCIVGPSSGPMHLASLCYCPHFIWTSNEIGKGSGNKRRYEVDWNPFKTPVYVHEQEDWNPKVEIVYSKLLKFMENLR